MCTRIRWSSSQTGGQGGDDFPYKRLYMKKQDILDRFGRLQNYKPEFIKFKYKILHLRDFNLVELKYLPEDATVAMKFRRSDYLDYNEISDYFIEPVRVRAKRLLAKHSLHEHWRLNKAKFAGMSPEKARDTLYMNFKEVNTFRPTIMAGLIEQFGAKSVLDPCSGWGDRLIGALAKGADYVGVDPNTQLAPKYKEIIEAFPGQSKAHMVCAPFETAELPDRPYDLVCTSPPYFNLEIYSDEDNQSISKYGDFEKWYVGFLITSIKKAWNVLQEGGVMVMIINEFQGPKYIRRMLNDVNLLQDALYLGVISYGDLPEQKIAANKRVHAFADYDLGNYQPMWIWRKHKLAFDWPINVEPVEVTGPNGPPGQNGPNGPTQSNCRRFNVVCDDQLIGGTKQRAHSMFTGLEQGEIIYAGPATGCAQIALALVAKKYNKYCTVFLGQDDSILTVRARMLGANVVILPKANLRALQDAAQKYAAQNKQARYLCPFGLDTEEFKAHLLADLAAKWQGHPQPRAIWLVAGSGTLLSTLYRLFPEAQFNVVQVGKKIWPDQLEAPRSKLYIAPEKFYVPAEKQPPYNTIKSYDAKLWQFVVEHGQDGDYIWNVCGEKNSLMMAKDRLFGARPE